MSGCSASADGTCRFAQRAIDEGNPDSAYRALGRSGLVTSSLGFGSYRIDTQTPEHAAALEKAMASISSTRPPTMLTAQRRYLSRTGMVKTSAGFSSPSTTAIAEVQQ